MVAIETARVLFRDTLLDLGIHASQITDGFDLELGGSYKTIPGVYTIGDTIPTLTRAFRLFQVKYVAPHTLRYTSDNRVCGSVIATELLGELDTTDAQTVEAYLRNLHGRVADYLAANGIQPTPQRIGTLLALVTYRCPGHNRGSIAALPHCAGDAAYGDVYLPFIAADASLTDIVTACAQRIGRPMPLNYMMNATVVRYGVLNLHEHAEKLDSIRLGIYDA